MKRFLPLALAATLTPAASLAGGIHAHEQAGAVTSPRDRAIEASYDVLAAHAHLDGNTAVFHMTMAGRAGAVTPAPAGDLKGAPVHAYVWTTTLDQASFGFEAGTGILALVATSHPDFDDTPLFDENRDGDLANDGALWHSHWVVLTPSEACGPGALSVRDIPEGATPAMPLTWPGLPLFIDSPGYTPQFDRDEIVLRIPIPAGTNLQGVGYDGVTSALRVNANLHAPLLCVTDVFDVASGDLSLPGRIGQ